MDKIRTYTGLNQYCLKNGQTRFLRMFYLVRCQDNHISTSEFIRIARTKAHLSEKAARQILRDGNRIWWTLSPKGVFISSVKKLCEVFEIYEGTLVLLPIEVFWKTQLFRAHLYASWFARRSWSKIDVDAEGMQPASGVIISREVLTKLFGIDKRTQKRYERLANIQKFWTFSYLRFTEDNIEIAPYHFEREGTGGIKHIDINGDGKKETVIQEANCYRVKMDCIPHRKIIRLDRGSFIREGTERSNRVYYDERGAAYKAISRGKVNKAGIKVLDKTVGTSRLYIHFLKNEVCHS